MKNKMQEVAKMFGLELGEKFDLISSNNKELSRCPYRFQERGIYDKDGYYMEGHVVSSLLNGNYKLVKKPWKPKTGDNYYYKDVDGSIYDTSFREDYCIDDLIYYYVGNCFKTEEEAEKFDVQFLKEFYNNGGV